MAAGRNGSSTTDVFDKLPPQNLEAERAVLGSLLLSHEAIDEVADVLVPRHFYADAHQRIAAAIYHLAETTYGGIDPVTVGEELERRGELADIGGAPYLAQIMEVVPLTAHARYYADIVRDKFVLRSLREACTGILHDIADEPDETLEVLSRAEQRIFSILEQQGEADKLEIRDILLDAFDGIDARIAQDGALSGLPTGFVELDSITSGLHPSEFVVIAARPSIGKTAFVCNIALAVATEARRKHLEKSGQNGGGGGAGGGGGGVLARDGVLMFSLEQSKLELAERLLCIHGKVNGHKLRKGELDDDERTRLLATSSKLAELPIFIDDVPGRSMGQIAAICRRVKRRYGLGLVVIDYLQLIEPEDRKAPREQQVAAIARRLKFLAKELNVPVISLAQLNRGVDLRADKQPKLADLRESGAIEQDADLVMFLHRPDAYDPADRPGEAELIVAKHRNGPTGLVPLTWIKESMRFENRSHLDEPEGGYFSVARAAAVADAF